jgi:hypothetical protein
MNSLNFRLLLQDVMTIADEVDAQLTQTMGSYMNLASSPKAPRLAEPTAALHSDAHPNAERGTLLSSLIARLLHKH